jgi:hypothetical protein
VHVGEQATWANLAAIECNCTIEAMMDKCLASISNRARGDRYQRGRFGAAAPRVPSWLHMPAYGLPVVASWGDNLGMAGVHPGTGIKGSFFPFYISTFFPFAPPFPFSLFCFFDSPHMRREHHTFGNDASPRL